MENLLDKFFESLEWHTEKKFVWNNLQIFSSFVIRPFFKIRRNDFSRCISVKFQKLISNEFFLKKVLVGVVCQFWGVNL